MKNTLIKFKVVIDKDLSADEICEVLGQSLVNVDNIYSYIVYANYNNNSLHNFHVEFLVSDAKAYNTILQEDMIAAIAAQILKHLQSDKQSYVIGYKQPPLNKLLELYEPLVQSLATKQHQYWRQLEYDDLRQMCRLCICTLYKAGYYLHKSLIQRAFTNDVLLSIRRERYIEQPVSLNRKLSYNSQNLELQDVIPDTSMLDKIRDQEDDDDKLRILQEKRDLIIEEVGARQYDQLVRAYTFGNTDQRSRTLVNRLKNKFIEQGITENTFMRYF